MEIYRRRKTMKIAIPVNEKKPESSVCVSFGRAPYFMLYDTDEKATEYITNTAAEAQSGAGLKAAQLIVDSGASVLLTIRCGQNAADVLNAAQIKIYKAEGAGATENLAAFQEGKLVPMTQFHAGFHGRQ
jgi:predicted Fe-Mo cluster-binding NifX family protein